MVLERPGDVDNFILLADDDEDDVFLFEEAIKLLDQAPQVMVAADGIAALEILSANDLPVLIFLDINMPRMNGIECFTRIRMDFDTTCVPVIFLSTSGNPHLIEEAQRLGAKGYIQKPLSFVKFQQILIDVFNTDWKSLENPGFFTILNK